MRDKEILVISIIQCISGFLHNQGEIEDIPRILEDIAKDYREQIELEK